MKIVLQCLLTLRAHFMPNGGGCNLSSSSSPNKSGNDVSMSWKLLGQTPGGNASSRDEVSPQAYTSTLSGEDRRKAASNSKFQRALRSPVMAGISPYQNESSMLVTRIASYSYEPVCVNSFLIFWFASHCNVVLVSCFSSPSVSLLVTLSMFVNSFLMFYFASQFL